MSELADPLMGTQEGTLSTNTTVEFNSKKHSDDSVPDKNEGKELLTNFSIFMLTINFIVGIGVLDLPYIFFQSGIVLCVIAVLLSALASQLAVHYVMEIQARAIMHNNKASHSLKASQLFGTDHYFCSNVLTRDVLECTMTNEYI